MPCLYVILLFRKGKNQRSKRALEHKESKVHENDKTAMFIKGGTVSERVSQVLKELVRINFFM